MSPRVSPGRRDCHCLSPTDIMADKEGVTLSLEEEEEDADVALAYKTPEKKSLQEIQELDPGDESLRKYKQALLGAIPAAVGKAGGCPLGLGTLPPRLGDAASAGTGSSGVPSPHGASPAGRVHPGWHHLWVLPVPPSPPPRLRGDPGIPLPTP